MYCLIKQEERTIGIIDLIASYPKVNTVYVGLYMIKQHRKGSGKKVLKEIERQVIAQGYKSLQLSVLKTNKAALDFWKKNGFQQTSVKQTTINSKTYDVIMMEKTFD